MRLIDAEGSELQTQLKIIREAEYQIYGSGSWGFTAKCEHAIEDAPTIQPKKGKWIEDKGQQTLMQNFIERGEVWRVCSVCGAGHMIGHKYECDKAYHETHHNFCPNCGADMRGDKNA